MARSSAKRKALARYKSQTNQMLRRAKLPAFDDFAVILRAAAAGNESAAEWLDKHWPDWRKMTGASSVSDDEKLSTK